KARVQSMRQPLQRAAVLAGVCMGFVVATPPAVADETCNSPYISNLITGQADFVHVWTLGVGGLGDGSDKLVTLDATPGSKSYGYDIAINPAKNVLLTSSFAGWQNYMRELGDLIKDAEAMKHFGSTMVVWNLKSMQPTQVLSVPGAPLEIRWALAPGQNWAITA